jgi:hypothetical protein
MPIERVTKKPEVANTPVPKELTPPPPDYGRQIIESNERLALVIRDAVEAKTQKKIVTATVERDSDGLIKSIRMEVE